MLTDGFIKGRAQGKLTACDLLSDMNSGLIAYGPCNFLHHT